MIINLYSSVSKHQQKNEEGLFYYASDPDYCCYLNKVKPLKSFFKPGDMWINGIRKNQSSVREKMKIVQVIDNGVIRLHPMLNWTLKDIYQYIEDYKLPKHPLDKKGYQSIGCVPCTQSCRVDKDRSGRWSGQGKTECGLHTETMNK